VKVRGAWIAAETTAHTPPVAHTPLFARTVLVACAVLFACAVPAYAVSSSEQDRPRRDEFGVIPEDAVDEDLTLPDPILDRTWPAPRPGDQVGPPKQIAPDEDEIDPFREEVVPVPVPKTAPPREAIAPPPPPRPLVGPDGKRDPGTPVPELEPYPAPILEPEINEPSEIDEEDNRPSPLDRDDAEFDQETNDPGDW